MSNIEHFCKECKGTLFTITTDKDYGLKIPQCMGCGSEGKPEERIMTANGRVLTGISRKMAAMDGIPKSDAPKRSSIEIENQLAALRRDWLWSWRVITLSKN